tara:strand:+ start:25737 stop:26330 length:594 start_codon:yes stop_codon:yes gene_type:complete
MPLDKVFKERKVEETETIAGSRPVQTRKERSGIEQSGSINIAAKAYDGVMQLPESPAVLLAEQLMSTPVITLSVDAPVTEALRQFQANAFRHLPVVSSVGKIVGMVSERDVLRYLAKVNRSNEPQASPAIDAVISEVMSPYVLTANCDTDVRYIARLFVEQHIGAVPVTKEGELKGIITRSDVLIAVMKHYRLELWI